MNDGTNTTAKRFCPICKKLVNFFGKVKGKTLTSCGCSWSFKKTRSQKEFDKKYVMTDWGLELRQAK